MLQEKYYDKGLRILAFPLSDFHQELSTDAEIQAFVKENYPQVTFPIFGLSTLKENPVYLTLQSQLPVNRVRGNFFKFLVDRHGKARRLFVKSDNPLSFEEEILALLDEPYDPRHGTHNSSRSKHRSY